MMMMRCSLRFLLVMAALLAAAPLARAQGVGDAATGRRVAERWCAACHLIDHDAGSARDATPTFTSIAARPATTVASLHTFLARAHGGMPDFSLSRDDVDNVTAYILSLRAK
jgi:mono/diheme cytochrome c family protein